MALEVEWLEPTTLDEALRLRAERPDATPLAGGTFVGTLINQRLLFPTSLLSLGRVAGLDGIERVTDGLRIGAMTRHRELERSALVHEGWPALAETFSLVASPRVRHQATLGGVLADADYASDPPAMLAALGARVIVSNARGERALEVEELITGYYETSLGPDELVTSVLVPPLDGRAVYRKFRSRSEEDRPCVSVAAARRDGSLRVVVGAVASRLQHFRDVCETVAGRPCSAREATEIGHAYAERIEPISDGRGSAEYRRRVIAVEVRRAIDQLEAAAR